MPRYHSWHVAFGTALLILSILLYVLHYLIFRDAHHIFVFLLEDIAFIPIHVLLISLIIDKIMNEREKKATFSRLNMVVSAFFNEVGTPLLKTLMQFDLNNEKLQKELVFDNHWNDKRFFQVRHKIMSDRAVADARAGDLRELQKVLAAKRDFLLRLLENPSVTEYETFTDMLMALFHLSDELVYREKMTNLPEHDWDHLSLDIERAYSRLIFEWLRYLNHLRRNYPYQYSLAVRVNPYNPQASPIVE